MSKKRHMVEIREIYYEKLVKLAKISGLSTTFLCNQIMHQFCIKDYDNYIYRLTKGNYKLPSEDDFDF